MTKKLPKARISEILVQEAGDEILLYDLRINKAYCLNETSAIIWQLCDGKNPVADISRLISKKLKMQVSEEFVWLALDSLKKDDLLEKSDEFVIDFGGLNRRELVKKVGLASIIALPIVASVVAPSALMAQSGATNLPLLSPCTINTQCQSGFCSQLTVGGTVCCTSIGNKLSPGAVLGPASVCSDSAIVSQCCSGVGALQPSIPVPGLPLPPLVNCHCG